MTRCALLIHYVFPIINISSRHINSQGHLPSSAFADEHLYALSSTESSIHTLLSAEQLASNKSSNASGSGGGGGGGRMDKEMIEKVEKDRKELRERMGAGGAGVGMGGSVMEVVDRGDED